MVTSSLFEGFGKTERKVGPSERDAVGSRDRFGLESGGGVSAVWASLCLRHQGGKGWGMVRRDGSDGDGRSRRSEIGRGGEGLIIFGCKNQPVVGLKDDVKIVLKKGINVKLLNSHEDYKISI